MQSVSCLFLSCYFFAMWLWCFTRRQIVFNCLSTKSVSHDKLRILKELIHFKAAATNIHISVKCIRRFFVKILVTLFFCFYLFFLLLLLLFLFYSRNYLVFEIHFTRNFHQSNWFALKFKRSLISIYVP